MSPDKNEMIDAVVSFGHETKFAARMNIANLCRSKVSSSVARVASRKQPAFVRD